MQHQYFPNPAKFRKLSSLAVQTRRRISTLHMHFTVLYKCSNYLLPRTCRAQRLPAVGFQQWGGAAPWDEDVSQAAACSEGTNSNAIASFHL